VKIGDIVPVMVKEVDEKGRVNLSIKQADPDYAERKGAKAATGPAPARPSFGSKPSYGSRPR
jgi:ribosomal protein S1